MSDYTRVYFEGLGIDFDVPSVAFTIGSYSIHWYGIIIAFGFALNALYFSSITCAKRDKTSALVIFL